MIVKIKVKYLIIFLGFLVISTSHLIKTSINNNFERKITSITKSIALSLNNIENQQRLTLTAATHAFREKIKHHTNPTSDDLKRWSSQFGVSGLEIFVKTKPKKARMIVSSFELNDKQKMHYNDHNLTTDEEESTYRDYDIKYEPYRRDLNYNGIALHATQVVWYKDINSWLNAIHFDYDINNILKQSLNMDDKIASLSILSPSGKKMFSTDDISQNDDLMSFEYNKLIQIKTFNDVVDAYLPFGDIYKLKSYQERSPSLLNKNGEYFYVLNVTFDKKELNHKIFILNIVTFSILIMLFISFFVLKRKGVKN